MILPYMQVHQDYSHHLTAEPLERVGMWDIYAWPTAVPEGWDRVSTPLLTEARLVKLREHCADCEWPEPTPRPIPEPVEDEDLFAEYPDEEPS